MELELVKFMKEILQSLNFSALKTCIQDSLLSRLHKKSVTISKPRKILIRKSSNAAYLDYEDSSAADIPPPTDTLDATLGTTIVSTTVSDTIDTTVSDTTVLEAVDAGESGTEDSGTDSVSNLLEKSLERIKVLEGKVEALQSSPLVSRHQNVLSESHKSSTAINCNSISNYFC